MRKNLRTVGILAFLLSFALIACDPQTPQEQTTPPGNTSPGTTGKDTTNPPGASAKITTMKESKAVTLNTDKALGLLAKNMAAAFNKMMDSTDGAMKLDFAGMTVPVVKLTELMFPKSEEDKKKEAEDKKKKEQEENKKKEEENKTKERQPLKAEDILKLLKEEVFKAENLQKKDKTSASFALRGESVCEMLRGEEDVCKEEDGKKVCTKERKPLDPSCVEIVNGFNIVLKLEELADQSVQVSVLVGDSEILASLRVGSGALQGTLDVAPAMKALTSLRNEGKIKLPNEFPTTLTGAGVLFAGFGGSMKLQVSIDKKIQVKGKAAGTTYEASIAKQPLFLNLSMDPVEKSIKAGIKLGAIAVKLGTGIFKKDATGFLSLKLEKFLMDAAIKEKTQAVTAGIDLGATQVEVDANLLHEKERGAIKAVLGGLSGRLSLQKGADMVLSNLSLGQKPTVVTHDGKTMVRVNLNPNDGRKLSVTIAEGEQPSLVIRPALDLKAMLNLSSFTEMISEDNPLRKAQALAIKITNNGKPSVLMPVKSDSFALKVQAGNLSLEHNGDKVSVEAGMCLVPSEGSSDKDEKKGMFSAGTCPGN